MNSVHNKKNGPSGNRTRLSTLRGSRTKPIFDGTKKYSEKSENETKKAEQKKCSALVPHGGFEPPQSEPESDVLPLHKRGMGELNIHFFGVSVNGVSANSFTSKRIFSDASSFAHKTGVNEYEN